jgi:hypothetical protein
MILGQWLLYLFIFNLFLKFYLLKHSCIGAYNEIVSAF